MRTYEELHGAEGKRVFYRAERYKAQDLFKRLLPEIALDNVSYRLCDISMNGLSAYAARGANHVHQLGDRPAVRLDLRGVTLHEGVGEVSRVEPTPLGTKVAVRLVDRCLNIGELVSKCQETMIRGDLDLHLGETDAVVAPEYRQLCADAVHLLRSFRATLERFAETQPSAAAAAEMLQLCERRLFARWKELWRRGNELTAPIMNDPAVVAATKRYTELVVTPELMSGASWRRSYEKPLGYPGDYQVMNHVYDWGYEGDTLFDKLSHHLALQTAECVATRMVMVRRVIAETVAAAGTGPARITSLGCGSAREVSDYLQLQTLPRQARFTLVDQDHGALSYAYEKIYPEVLRLAGRASVSCLQTSFMELLKANDLFRQIPPQDLIYSVGLLDYLAPKRARAFIAALYQHLAPGGTLLIGNMLDAPTGSLWPSEFILDWTLIYRTEKDMRDLVEGLPAAAVTTEIDPTGGVVMLRLNKPA
jgi:extracellular factor (EF) 3-hydroxypalmitic acid methyl ester biosynthesis protein